MNWVKIIAEAGTNHNGDMETAWKLVDVASEASADSVKFQVIYPEGLYLPRFFNDGSYMDNEVYRDRRTAMLSDDEYRALADYCATKGIELSASVFDKRGVDLLVGLQVRYIKIASCDLNNSRLLMYAAEQGKRLVISTGMASLPEIERAVTDVFRAGNRDVVLMHCVSVYPCPIERMNLSYIRVLKESFDLPVGLSDHTEHSLCAAAAVAMGVEWIEKHFTLDRRARGFDHAYAMEPDGLKGFIKDVRSVEEACRPQGTKIGADEAKVKSRARRGLYAARNIGPGEIVGEADVLVVRPEGSLAPNDLPLVVGKRAKRVIATYEVLSLDTVH
jgi:sialic acid synthase SpsE